jgi:hypothetical protein
MNAAFIVPFATSLFAALQDTTHQAAANLLRLVYNDCEDDAPRIYPTRPSEASSPFVVIDLPFGGRTAYVHGEGEAVAEWTRFQASTWAQTKLESLEVMDALIQAIDGRDIVVSDTWGTVRIFMVAAPWSQVDEIGSVTMYGAGARFEVLLLT